MRINWKNKLEEYIIVFLVASTIRILNNPDFLTAPFSYIAGVLIGCWLAAILVYETVHYISKRLARHWKSILSWSGFGAIIGAVQQPVINSNYWSEESGRILFGLIVGLIVGLSLVILNKLWSLKGKQLS